MPDPEITGIGQIHITVADVPRAVAFYRDVLGLPLLFEVPEQSMAFLDCGGVRLYLGRAEEGQAESRPLLYFRVGDIEAAWEALGESGASRRDAPHLVHRGETADLWLASLEDPEGNPVCLMEERLQT